MNGRNPRFDFELPVPALSDLGRVHLIAIGGSGMSAVARILLARGVPVSGSDAKASAALEALQRSGARVFVGHDAAQVADVDTVVISSAIREDNVELARARELGLRVLHRAQALASAMADRRAVAVAGANGKTTTTSMLTVAVQHCGADPSFASGGELVGQETNAAWGSGPAFIAEADESDGSFLVYRPEIAIVTNVQPDHLDFYGTVENVQAAYAAFAASVRPGGLLVSCADDPGSAALADRHRAAGGRVLTYGMAADSDIRLGTPQASGLGSTSWLTDTVAGDAPAAVTLQVPGDHNVRNAGAAYTAAVHGLGLPAADVLAGLAAFAGARRRFEVRGEVRGVTVVDDYAHNAPKVAAVVTTAAGIARDRGGRLHVAFQPHLFSRTRDFAAAFAEGLAAADTVSLLDVYGAREVQFDGISSELIAAPLRALPGQREVRVGGSFAQVAHDLAVAAAAGDLVLTVGAGDVTTLAPLVLAELEATGAVPSPQEQD